MNVESFKAAIRPSLAIWAMSMLALSFALTLPMETMIKWICAAVVLEWVGERGIKRAKEMFGTPGS
jgi:hypothetical protein